VATINNPGDNLAFTVVFVPVLVVVVAGVLRWHVHLFRDHVALGPWFGQERVIALDQIDEAFIETRGSGNDRTRELYLKVAFSHLCEGSSPCANPTDTSRR
jgi:hypothetical protein